MGGGVAEEEGEGGGEEVEWDGEVGDAEERGDEEAEEPLVEVRFFGGDFWGWCLCG